MRTIKFRGLRADGGGWVCGHYFFDHVDGTHFIDNYRNGPVDMDNGHSDLIHEWIEVKPETVGQFTGLTDKNGVEIWEGDLVRNQDGDLRQVVYWQMSFEMRNMVGERANGDFIWHFKSEVIGNIHETPPTK